MLRQESRTVEKSFNCPRCGELIEPRSIACPRCGGDLSNYPRYYQGQVKYGAQAAIYVSAACWMGLCAAWVWVYLSNYLKGNFFPPTLNDNDHFAYISSAIFSGVVILFLSWTSVGMIRFKKLQRMIAALLSWIGSTVGTLGLIAVVWLFTLKGLSEGSGPSDSLLGIAFLVCMITISNSWCTRWAIRHTKAMEQ